MQSDHALTERDVLFRLAMELWVMGVYNIENHIKQLLFIISALEVSFECNNNSGVQSVLPSRPVPCCLCPLSAPVAFN